MLLRSFNCIWIPDGAAAVLVQLSTVMLGGGGMGEVKVKTDTHSDPCTDIPVMH